MGDREKYFIVDAYNHNIFPGDEIAKQNIAIDVNVSHENDRTYLNKVEKALDKAFREFRPEFVIYNAGTDCLVGD